MLTLGRVRHLHWVSSVQAALWSGGVCSVMCVCSMLPPKDPGGQHVGFLLNSLGVTVALTSDTTAKNLPKDDSKDHIVQFKGEERGGGGEEGREGGEERGGDGEGK